MNDDAFSYSVIAIASALVGCGPNVSAQPSALAMTSSETGGAGGAAETTTSSSSGSSGVATGGSSTGATSSSETATATASSVAPCVNNCSELFEALMSTGTFMTCPGKFIPMQIMSDLMMCVCANSCTTQCESACTHHGALSNSANDDCRSCAASECADALDACQNAPEQTVSIGDFPPNVEVDRNE